jgi:predicted metal-dependent enzyme (double-stranded beta helix superfamily)
MESAMQPDPEIDALVNRAKAELKEGNITRAALEKVLSSLLNLASNSSKWSHGRFPDPKEDERQARYLLREDKDKSFALYLNVMRPGKRIPPHNHTTWACVSAVTGTEHNVIYERVDGASGPGPAKIKVVREVAVSPGIGVALLPTDIHSVEIKGSEVIRHLHFYGRALETLTDRLMFDMAAGIAKPMGIGVETRMS